MANKYIIHGAAFCGDGTSSAEASSNGGVGAWNNIGIFEGNAPSVYSGAGAVAAGDTVYIRSKDSLGADIARSLSANVTLGSSAASLTSGVTWKIDDGVIWSGVSGTVTYTVTTQNTVTLRDYNLFVASAYNLVIVSSMTGFGTLYFVDLGRSSTIGLKVDMSAHTGSYGGGIKHLTGAHTNLWVRAYNLYQSLFLTNNVAGIAMTLFNPKIEILYAAAFRPLFWGSGNYDGRYVIYGGEVSGAGANAGGFVIFKTSPNGCAFASYGLKFPRAVQLSKPADFTSRTDAIAISPDNVQGDAYFASTHCYDSRNDGYYPTLNGRLSTSGATPWSYKLYPFLARVSDPAVVNTIKLYTQSAAAKTITLEFLWPDTLAAPTKDKVFLTVGYTDDATGNKVAQTTYSPAGEAVDTSSANWLPATTYGPVNFSKRKLQITTQSSIKKDTELMISLSVIATTVTSDDVIFIDPDPVLS